MKSILIVILGCNILNILYDRINVAIQLGNTLSSTKTNNFNLSEVIVTDKIVQSNNSFDEFDDLNNFDQMNNLTIDWFLTGGIKDKKESNSKAEASVMIEELDSHGYGGSNFNYIIDYNSTNTVENFIFLKKYLEFNNTKNYTDLYVVTSKFHHQRANMILSKIIPNNNFTWVLSEETTKDLEFWESYHINNVYRDIQRAALQHNFTLEV